ncbi:MAG TPA: hypothetical protein DD670_12650 [Planctomycetaceae bacterium]|nr:hypothetical protein [Planctomycetaceae bacterium]
MTLPSQLTTEKALGRRDDDTIRIDGPSAVEQNTVDAIPRFDGLVVGPTTPEDRESSKESPMPKEKRWSAGLAFGVGAIVIVVGLVAHWLLSPSVGSDAPGQEAGASSSAAKKAVPVVLATARAMTFEDRATVSGSVRAKRYAMVSARIPGTLDDVFVDEGDRVEAGKTRLFQTDSLKLMKAVAIAKQNLAVSESTVREKEALLEKGLAVVDQAASDLRRYRALLQRDAIAAQAAEQQESHHKQCEADARHSQALVDLAKAQLEQARLGLTIAEKDMADSLVLAPIDGMVAERFREPGEMASAGTPVVRIEDLTLLEICVFLPEKYHALVIPGKTTMRVTVGRADLGEREVSYRSPTVDSKFRTFEVRGLIESPPEGVVPGCMATVTIVTDSNEGVGVPSGAIQTREGKPVVFTVVEDQARMVPVRPGSDNGEWREIVEGVSAGTRIIAKGQFLVEEGTPVSIVEEGGR